MLRVDGVVVAADALGHTFDVRVLKMDRPDGRKVLKFDGALGPEGCGIARRAMSIKSALRDLLSVSYDMKTILLTGSLRSPPPFPAAPDFPRSSVGQSKGRLFYGQAKGLL